MTTWTEQLSGLVAGIPEVKDLLQHVWLRGSVTPGCTEEQLIRLFIERGITSESVLEDLELQDILEMLSDNQVSRLTSVKPLVRTVLRKLKEKESTALSNGLRQWLEHYASDVTNSQSEAYKLLAPIAGEAYCIPFDGRSVFIEGAVQLLEELRQLRGQIGRQADKVKLPPPEAPSGGLCTLLKLGQTPSTLISIVPWCSEAVAMIGKVDPVHMFSLEGIPRDSLLRIRFLATQGLLGQRGYNIDQWSSVSQLLSLARDEDALSRMMGSASSQFREQQSQVALEAPVGDCIFVEEGENYSQAVLRVHGAQSATSILSTPKAGSTLLAAVTPVHQQSPAPLSLASPPSAEDLEKLLRYSRAIVGVRRTFPQQGYVVTILDYHWEHQLWNQDFGAGEINSALQWGCAGARDWHSSRSVPDGKLYQWQQIFTLDQSMCLLLFAEAQTGYGSSGSEPKFSHGVLIPGRGMVRGESLNWAQTWNSAYASALQIAGQYNL